MMTTLRPGANRETVLSRLRELRTSAANLLGGSSATAAADYFINYADWCINAVRTLEGHVATADVERLLLESPKGLHSGLLGLDHQNASNARRLVNYELERRIGELDLTIHDLQEAGRRWDGPGRLVVPDSSFYLEHDTKLEEVEFGALVGDHSGPVHVLLPMIVVDELDGRKKGKTWWRASYTLAVVDRILEQPTKPGLLHDEEPEFVNTLLEIVMDPPGHVRLPLNDDEIIARCVAIQTMAERQVLLLTYDTGQSTRGRAAGLGVLKFSKSVPDEP